MLASGQEIPAASRLFGVIILRRHVAFPSKIILDYHTYSTHLTTYDIYIKLTFRTSHWPSVFFGFTEERCLKPLLVPTMCSETEKMRPLLENVAKVSRQESPPVACKIMYEVLLSF